MSNKVYPYLYDRQFETAIGQFMRVMAGFQYYTGKKDTNGDKIYEKISVRYGTMDRIVASILSGRDTNHNNRKLPVISVAMTGLVPEPEKRRPTRHRDELSTRGYEDNPRVAFRKIGQSFNMSLETNLIASSKSELFSILEQILLVFNPRVTIKLDSNALSVDNTTQIALENIQSEVAYPVGNDKPMVSYSLTFTMPVRLHYPVTGDADFIDEIVRTTYTSEDGTEENINSEGIEERITDEDLDNG